jgi:phospholipid/cholesterol/gamma-HCH transport system permease protein
VTVLEDIGGGVIQWLCDLGRLTMQFWSGLRALPQLLPVLGRRGHWRTALVQMVAIGIDALPMLAILSMTTGFIFAMQSGAELRRYGALQLVVYIIGIGFTRELGPLLAAVVASSRSGSAFSAEIGTMVVTNEINVLRTMGLDPIEFVVAPKFIAAVITIPCLTLMSELFGILAGGAFMMVSTKITLVMYLRAVADSIALRDIFMGLLKSIAFATIVVHVGCLEGFRTHGGPDAVGRSATSGVVKSTLLVLLADMLFTAIFYMARLE